jgi:hypothetical protein
MAAGVTEYDGTLMHMRVLDGYDAAEAERLWREWPRPPSLDSIAGRVVLSGQIEQIRDANADPNFSMPSHETRSISTWCAVIT